MNALKQNSDHGHFHFKQWSRKAYAMFNSLGRVVHISALSVPVSQWLGRVIMHVDTILHQTLEDEADDDDILLSNEELLTLELVTNMFSDYASEILEQYTNCRY